MADAKPALVSLALTNVHYNPDDPLSHISAWLSLLPQALCLTYILLIYTTREIEIALTFLGQLACEALNWGLKRWFKEARPEAIRELGKGYGMPSSHAQFVSFFGVSVCAFLVGRRYQSSRGRGVDKGARMRGQGQGQGRVGMNGTTVFINGTERREDDLDESTTPRMSDVYRLQLHHPKLTHSLLSIATLVLAAAVAVSRVYLQYHTVKQVVVGCCLGTVFAIAWFVATEFVRRTGLVEWVLDLQIVRAARIRDLICEEDLVEIGWQIWEEKRQRRNRARTLAKKSQ